MSNYRIRGVVVASLLLVVAGTSFESFAITYNVNRTIGAGSVTGFIQTDGTIGVLNSANVVDWTLLLDDGTGTFTLLGPLSGNNSQLGISGSSYVATATDVVFNFSSLGDYALYQNPSVGSGLNFWCVEGSAGACTLNSSAEVVALNFNDQEVAFRTGIVVVASVVPEPSAIVLVGLGLASIACYRRRVDAIWSHR
jgi:hypothetical protein